MIFIGKNYYYPLLSLSRYHRNDFLIQRPCYTYPNFSSSFVKIALTKNPKKRPAAEKMLYQPFVLSGDLSVRQSLELLNKVRNPESIYGPTSVTSGSGSVNQVAANQRGGASGAIGQPNLYSADPDGDDDVMVRPPPARIESRSSRTSQKTKSELNSKYQVSVSKYLD